MTMVNHPNTRRLDFLVFSDDWGEHPSSCQHIFRHIAKDHRVIWVNTIGMRNPTLSWTDARKVVVKISKMLGRKRESVTTEKNKNITVCQPLMLPGSRSRAVRAFNARSVTRKVTAMMRDLVMTDPIVVTTVPNAADYPELLTGPKVVYYCVDDFSLWPGLDADVVREMEARLLARADCIIAASETLAQRLSTSGKPTHLLTHGVDFELFSTHAEAELPALKDIPRPRVGFFGLIDGRMDWDLVAQLAKQMPDVSLVFAGPVDTSAGELPHAENVHFIGRVDYQNLPEFISGLESLMLPYRAGMLADALAPLKLKEYLATGKQVLSTPIAEALRWSSAVKIVYTVAEWIEALHKVGCDVPPAERSQTMNRLATESWRHKANEYLRICAY